MIFHPSNMWQSRKKRWSLRGFVNRSAFCISILQYLMITILDFINDMKWWYFKAMCLVRGEIFRDWSIFIQDWLYSWTVHMKFGYTRRIGNILLISSKNFINGITSLRSWYRAMYYASAVLRTISVWSLETKWMGHPAYAMA